MIALSPRQAARGRRALPFALVVLGVAAFDLRFHEFWRDEAGAMLEARAVPWGSLLEAMRVEGVPPLFHALLKVAGAVLPNPLALVAVGALGLGTLLLGTYRFLVALSGARRGAARATLALALTYAYAYELGAVIRQYALGLGLALLSLACLRDALRGDRRAVRTGALAAGLAALTSAHAACVAGAGLLAFGVIALARRRALRGWWPILLTLPCFALVAYLASPYPLRVAEGNAQLHFPAATTARLSLQALVEGVMPSDWWLVESFVPPPLRGAVAALRSLAFWGVVLGAAAALAARVARWRVSTFEVLAVVVSWVPLLVIIVNHYWGFHRHHLFLGLPLLVVLTGWGLDERVEGKLAGELRRWGLALLVPWFLFEAGIAAGSFALDARHPFSDTKSAAQVLGAGAHVVADADWRSMGMLFWRPDIQMRSMSWRGRRFRYARPDREWHATAALAPLLAEECREAPDRVYFAGYPASLGGLARCGKPVPYPTNTLGEHPFTWESFELLRMDCGCVAGGKGEPPPGAW
jgi:hypothetical protein